MIPCLNVETQKRFFELQYANFQLEQVNLHNLLVLNEMARKCIDKVYQDPKVIHEIQSKGYWMEEKLYAQPAPYSNPFPSNQKKQANFIENYPVHLEKKHINKFNQFSKRLILEEKQEQLLKYYNNPNVIEICYLNSKKYRKSMRRNKYNEQNFCYRPSFKLKRKINFEEEYYFEQKRKLTRNPFMWNQDAENMQDQIYFGRNQNPQINQSSDNQRIYPTTSGNNNKQASNMSNTSNLLGRQTSEFKIGLYEHPMTHHYIISIISYDFPKRQLNKILKKHGIKQATIKGEIYFERCVPYHLARKAVIQKILIIFPKLKELFFESKQLTLSEQLTIDIQDFKRDSSHYDSNCYGNLILPLKLTLDEGLDYKYDYYDGEKVKNMIIFSQNAQIYWLDVIDFGKQPKNRNLKGKVKLTSMGINIKTSILDQKLCQVSFFRRFVIFGKQQVVKKNDNITPFQLDSRFKDKQFDDKVPYRYYGRINNWGMQRQQLEKKAFTISLKMKERIGNLVQGSIKIGQMLLSWYSRIMGLGQVQQQQIRMHSI